MDVAPRCKLFTLLKLLTLLILLPLVTLLTLFSQLAQLWSKRDILPISIIWLYSSMGFKAKWGSALNRLDRMDTPYTVMTTRKLMENSLL